MTAILVFASTARADRVNLDAVPDASSPGFEGLAPEDDTRPRRDPDGPPLTARRVGGELLLGVAAATAGTALGGALGAGYCEARPGGNCAGEVLLGSYAGAALALPIGVYVVGAMGDHEGSLAATMVGSAIGGGLGLGLLAIDDDVGILTILTLAAGPPLGALIGFNSTRRWDRAPAPPGTALLSVRGGDLALGFPLVTRGADVTGAPITTLSLAGGTF